MKLELEQTVYHRDVYNHREPLKIVGIRQFELELEGDYSGGISNIIQKQWIPIKGVSRVFDYKYKRECRNIANDIGAAARPIPSRGQCNMTKTMFDLLHMVYHLTMDVELNPEY